MTVEWLRLMVMVLMELGIATKTVRIEILHQDERDPRNTFQTSVGEW